MSQLKINTLLLMTADTTPAGLARHSEVFLIFKSDAAKTQLISA